MPNLWRSNARLPNAVRSAGGILEGSDEDDSASTNSGLILNNDPSKYVLENPPQFGNLGQEL